MALNRLKKRKNNNNIAAIGRKNGKGNKSLTFLGILSTKDNFLVVIKPMLNAGIKHIGVKAVRTLKPSALYTGTEAAETISRTKRKMEIE